MAFNLMNEHTFEIETAPSTYSTLASGINNAEPANNEELSQDRYMDSDGFADTDVIGAQLTLAFTGHRKYGDAAQDYIFGKLLTLGSDRRTKFKWTEPDGGVFEGSCTIANISGPTGAAGAKGEVSFEIHFNGLPTYTPGTP